MKSHFLILFAFAAALDGAPVRADADPWTLNLYFENDLFGETDQNYTNGIRISWISPDIGNFETDPMLPDWVKTVNDHLHFFHDLKHGLQRNLVISLGQLIYTPKTIDATELLEDERPYAGYLYMGFAYQSRNEHQMDTIEVDLGVVGPAAQGEEAQDFIHDLRGFDKFKGWDNQLKNEPALQLVYEHKHRLFEYRLAGNLEHDLIGHVGGALGNVGTYLNMGAEYRLGWDLPSDFGTSAVRPGGDNSAPGRGDPRLRTSTAPIYGLHAFISLDTRLVARDIFLDGNTWRDSHNVSKEKEVADVSAGVSFLVGRWKFSYAHVIRSREFKQQPHHHEYGSLSISYSW